MKIKGYSFKCANPFFAYFKKHYCPGCQRNYSINETKENDFLIDRTNWYDTYKALTLYGGQIEFILEDDEDMIEIRYDDGMLIDIGKPAALQHYIITVVGTDDANGWQNPLAEIAVADKADLFQKIQESIFKYRTQLLS